jgi:hypothetical protein
MEKPEIM